MKQLLAGNLTVNTRSQIPAFFIVPYLDFSRRYIVSNGDPRRIRVKKELYGCGITCGLQLRRAKFKLFSAGAFGGCCCCAGLFCLHLVSTEAIRSPPHLNALSPSPCDFPLQRSSAPFSIVVWSPKFFASSLDPPVLGQ